MLTVALLASGFLAGLLIQPGGILDNTSVGEVLTAGGGGGMTVAVIAASVITMVVSRRALLAGLVVVAALAAGISSWFETADFVSVVAGGVLLGCAAVQARVRASAQAVLIASFLAGLLSAGAIDALRSLGFPSRYADYLSEPELSPPVVVPVLAVLVFLTAAWILRSVESDRPQVRDTRTVLAVALVPLGGLLLNLFFVHRLFGDSDSFGGTWYFGALVVPVLFIVAALLPGRGGMPVLAGTAVLLTSSTLAGVGISIGDEWWVLGLVLVTVIAVAAGAAAGLRWKHPTIGIAVLAVVSLTALFDRPPLDNVAYAASLLAFPVAAAYVFAACLPATSTTLTLGLAVPAAITVPMILTYGWTAYTPLTSIDTSTFSPTADLWLSTGIAVGAVVLAGVGMRILSRRPT